MPLEAIGLTSYTILDSDRGDYSGTSYEGMRGAAMTVSTEKTATKDLRMIVRDIKADEDYRGYDFLEINFTDRYAGFPIKGFAFVAITEEGERAAGTQRDKISSGSQDGDGVYFFDVSGLDS